MKLSPSDRRLLLACFMPCRGCKLECRYYHRPLVDKGTCSLCRHSVKQHVPVDAREQAALLSRLLEAMEHRLTYPARLTDSNPITVQMLCESLIGAVFIAATDEASIARWVFVEESIDQDVACLFRAALLSSSGVSTPFPGISRRLKRELDCRDSLLYHCWGDVHAELIATFMLNRRQSGRCVVPAAFFGQRRILARLLASHPDAAAILGALYGSLKRDNVTRFKKQLDRFPSGEQRRDAELCTLGHAISADAVDIVTAIFDRHRKLRSAVNLEMFEEGCRLGSHGTIRLLLKRIPAVGQDWPLSNALHFATVWGHIEIVRILLDHVPPASYGSLLHTSCIYLRAPDIADLLLARGAVPSPSDIVACRSPLVLRSLLAAGNDINQACPETGVTPLMYAALDDDEEMARLLLDNRAGVNAASIYDQTALHYAAYNGSMGVMRLLLLVADANVNARSIDGYTPLAFAHNGSQSLAAQILTCAGAQM